MISEKIIAKGISIPLSVNITLLKIADKYCNIEVWPNLKCKLDKPNDNL